MNVLSLFDGMGCGQLALKRAGIKVDKYYASEIDKFAIQVAQSNFPDTIQLGDITKISNWFLGGLPEIDLLIGGSPCQGFSIAGKKLNFDDPRSLLFFDFVRVLEEVKPKYFLLENTPMKKEFQDIISSYLGVEPTLINSNLVSAQNRKRLYWTNIPEVCQPEDRGVEFKDILESEVNEKYYINTDKAIEICSIEHTKGKIVYIGNDDLRNSIYSIHGQSVILTDTNTETAIPYCFPCLTPSRVHKRQNGQRFKPSNAKFYTLTAQDRHGVLMNGRMRHLTPLECERLQTLPDGYTECVSDPQRYKMLGNGWTVDIIVHIFSKLNKL